MICGGFRDFNSHCHWYDDESDDWRITPFRLTPKRYGAMSAEVRPGEWLIMGGRAAQRAYFSDTILFKNGKFSPRPRLPEAVYQGSVVMLDENRLFIAGAGIADGSDTSGANFLLDINTGEWTKLPERLVITNGHTSRSHASGTFYNSTADEIQIANVGYLGIHVYSPKSNSWNWQHEFPQEIQYVWDSVAVQNGRNSFYLIGGSSKLGKGHVFEFDTNGLRVVKKDVLAVPRRGHIAIRISRDQIKGKC